MGPHHLYESVPNFSEGTRADVIAELAAAAGRAYVIDVDADADHNRVVISVVGQTPQLLDALVASVQVAMQHIDLREHRGVHPRVGAADVIPIVPLDGASLADAHELARMLGDRVWDELKVPVYYYGHGEELTLFRLAEPPPSAVVAELERGGVSSASQQVIALAPAAVANQAATGRLLEARLAAAVARRGGLKREAAELARTGIDQDALLLAAKRSAALIPVLRAAGVLGEDMRTMLDIAVRGLRSAALRTD